MSLTTLGTAANVFGVIMPARDFGEIIKGIADSIQEVKMNEASTSYWDKTLKDRARDVYHFMARSKHAGISDLQTRAQMKLFESLVVLRKEIIENNRHSYLTKLVASGDIRRKIKWVEMEMRQCQDLFLTDTQVLQADMLSQINREVREIANRDGRNSKVECTVIRWNTPGKADDPMVIVYTYLAKKCQSFIYELKSNSGYVQKLLLETDNNIKTTSIEFKLYPEGNPLSECEDAGYRIIHACKMLRNRNWDNTSLMEWLIDNDQLSNSLFSLGLTKEARQIQELLRQIWSFLASWRGSAPIYSRLAQTLRYLAVSYFTEGRYAEALSLVEQAIQKCPSLGDSSLPYLAECLSCQSLFLHCLGRFEESLAFVQKSVAIMRRLFNDNLSLYGLNLELRLVHSLRRQADALLSLSQHEEALRCSQEALQWLSKATPHYKQVHSYLYAHVSWLIAKSHRNLGNHEQAKDYGRRALSVYHALVCDRPLFYSHNLSYTLLYSSWFGHESALTVLDESLIACLRVDRTFTAPQLADILDRRAAALISSTRYKEALDSYNQAIDIRRLLLEGEEGGDFKQFKGLLQSFRLRALCMLSLHREHDALSSVDAAQDAIVSRLKIEINAEITNIIRDELEDQYNLLKDCTRPDCIELISSLRSCKKVLSYIHEIKCASWMESTVRSDLGKLSNLEYWIYVMAGRLNIALMSIQDAIDFYRSQIEQNRTQNIRADLVTSLVLHTRCCTLMDDLEQALCSMNNAVVHLRVDMNHNTEGSRYHFFEVFDLYSPISYRLRYECGSHKELTAFLEAAIGILRSPIMTSHSRTRPTLAWVLADKGHLLYNLGSYEEAVIASEESVNTRRKLVAEGEWHKWDLAFSLYWLAKSQLATDDTTAAWTTVEEGIDVLIEREDPHHISYDLELLIFLRSDILLCLGRAPDVHDALLESLLLEITPGRQDDSESNGGNESESDVASDSRSEDDDESESESVYVSAVDDSDWDDSSGNEAAS